MKILIEYEDKNGNFKTLKGKKSFNSDGEDSWVQPIVTKFENIGCCIDQGGNDEWSEFNFADIDPTLDPKKTAKDLLNELELAAP